MPGQPTMTHALAAQILAALPQTQCTRCGYPDCAAYAQAIAAGEAAINQCPPGGSEGILRLAKITGQPVAALNPENGTEGPRSVAFIDENWCIGCTLCIDACPTDAIVGSNKVMHTVIEPYCTGCELCLPVCPVDCIVLENVSGSATGWAAWSPSLAIQAEKRYEFHSFSCLPDAASGYESLQNEAANETKAAVLEAALARARARKA
jgi:Na+-translocating ferredoxin:NAD+ oxidoreductase subunit B